MTVSLSKTKSESLLVTSPSEKLTACFIDLSVPSGDAFVTSNSVLLMLLTGLNFKKLVFLPCKI